MFFEPVGYFASRGTQGYLIELFGRVPRELLSRWPLCVANRQLAIDLGKVASQEDSVASYAVFYRDTFLGDGRPLGIEFEECVGGAIQSESFVLDIGAIVAREVPEPGPALGVESSSEEPAAFRVMDEQSDFLEFRDLFFEFGGGDRFGLGVLVGKAVFLQRALIARG